MKVLKYRKSLIVKILAAGIVIFLLSFFLNGIEYALLMLLSVIIHESGHLCAAKILKVPIVKSENHFLHLSYKLDFSASTYFAEMAVSLSGALFNLLFAFLTVAVFRSPFPLGVFFVFSNLTLAVFNLLPVSSLDGAGALEAFLSVFLSNETACRITEAVSLVTALSFFVLSVYIQMRVGANFSLMIISLVMLCTTLGAKETF